MNVVYEWYKNSTFLTVYTENMGYLSSCEVAEQKGKFVIWAVRVNAMFRHQGHGTKLLQKVVDKYACNDKPLELYVYKDNEVAIHLYEKLGFKITGEYKERENAWVMRYVQKEVAS